MTSTRAPWLLLVRSLTVGSRYARMDLFLIRHVWQFVQQASTKWKRKIWMASNPGLPRTQTFNHAQIMQLYLSHRGLRQRLTDYADLLTWSCLLTLVYVPWEAKIKGFVKDSVLARRLLRKHTTNPGVMFEVFFLGTLTLKKGWYWNENDPVTVMLDVS